MEKEIIDVIIPLDIPIENLIDSLKKSLSKGELIEFIKELDLSVAEYDFTKKLRDHFVLELAKEDSLEEKELELGRHRK